MTQLPVTTVSPAQTNDWRGKMSKSEELHDLKLRMQELKCDAETNGASLPEFLDVMMCILDVLAETVHGPKISS
jgi:hypothetical protein